MIQRRSLITGLVSLLFLPRVEKTKWVKYDVIEIVYKDGQGRSYKIVEKRIEHAE